MIGVVDYINQVVILAGGKGTRMREMTSDLPKPMVDIGGRPVLDHLIEIFNNFGKFEYIICTGYLGDKIQEYYKGSENIKVVHTGDETNTGGRVSKLRDILNNRFIVTYGDGLANVNILELIDFHKKNKRIGTVTVTNPTSRFGLVEFDENNVVKQFIEKPKLDGFVNIGFFVFEKIFLDYLNENSILESEPLRELSKNNQLDAFVHNGYFEPMDTYREYLSMNKLWKSGDPPWLKQDI